MAFARNEPGLLSWNVSTLLSRIMATRSVLRLPPELALSLLAFNRPLLNHPELLPQKLQALQRVLGVTGARSECSREVAVLVVAAACNSSCRCRRASREKARKSCGTTCNAVHVAAPHTGVAMGRVGLSVTC